ncbi:hypothetical protein HETIRDRAFT_120799 [Heterobasidion irregulare TC 32-1]|uniref:Uncharacterized protein n=1 Tax=Heterobasidion irregulare (strain TC 32-1) TaxID=747525 RepID=W4KB00_HETIT|nr:uncharacterized protein HETIRDRAFT_120799 [Heterobasidion irregulare TC 32-1]ETW82545.1 hypothetical protein HETIRDRAFT_120799 [Heterobasidion irregulare TC 32-1]
MTTVEPELGGARGINIKGALGELAGGDLFQGRSGRMRVFGCEHFTSSVGDADHGDGGAGPTNGLRRHGLTVVVVVVIVTAPTKASKGSTRGSGDAAENNSARSGGTVASIPNSNWDASSPASPSGRGPWRPLELVDGRDLGATSWLATLQYGGHTLRCHIWLRTQGKALQGGQGGESRRHGIFFMPVPAVHASRICHTASRERRTQQGGGLSSALSIRPSTMAESARDRDRRPGCNNVCARLFVGYRPGRRVEVKERRMSDDMQGVDGRRWYFGRKDAIWRGKRIAWGIYTPESAAATYGEGQLMWQIRDLLIGPFKGVTETEIVNVSSAAMKLREQKLPMSWRWVVLASECLQRRGLKIVLKSDWFSGLNLIPGLGCSDSESRNFIAVDITDAVAFMRSYVHAICVPDPASLNIPVPAHLVAGAISVSKLFTTVALITHITLEPVVEGDMQQVFTLEKVNLIQIARIVAFEGQYVDLTNGMKDTYVPIMTHRKALPKDKINQEVGPNHYFLASRAANADARKFPGQWKLEETGDEGYIGVVNNGAQQVISYPSANVRQENVLRQRAMAHPTADTDWQRAVCGAGYKAANKDESPLTLEREIEGDKQQVFKIETALA